MQGKIVKGVAGSYEVHVPGIGKYECKARGIFRKDQKKPLVGDDVLLEELAEEGKGVITEILGRKSELLRPAVANVDQALVIFSVKKPQPNLNLLDRFLVMMGQQGLPCLICFNKEDLDESGEGQEYRKVYEACGYRVLMASARRKDGIRELSQALEGKTTTVAGPSGVGKSSLVNCLQSGTVMETGDISHKIERGKHTTRHTELISIGGDSYILDTPGFGSLDLFDLEKEDLEGYYPEFSPYRGKCRFAGCSHMAEPDCAVKEALKEGKVSRLRYENYCLLYEELKKRKKY